MSGPSIGQQVCQAEAPTTAIKSKMVGGVPLLSAGLLIVLTLGVVFLGPRLGSWGHDGTLPLHDAVAAERLLRFADRDDGAVVVTDAADGHVLAVITGQNGFLRGTMSGLARIRRVEGIGTEPPFKLTSYVNHRLTISDPATGKVIELEAFGLTNEGVFAQLIMNRAPSEHH